MPGDDRRTARQRRDDARAAFARALGRSLAEHDVSQKALALSTGHDASIVQRWTDPGEPETPHVSDLVNFAACEGGRAVARDLIEHAAAELGLEVRERADATDSTGRAGERTASLAKELHEAVQAALLLLLRRGPGEHAAALREAREAQREIGDFIAVLERALGKVVQPS